LDNAILIGDIGGTNARFAVIGESSRDLHFAQTYPCADFPNLIDAIQHYLEQNDLPAPESMFLAVAGPVANGKVSLTNNHWSISTNELRKAFGCERIQLINDFEALAYSIPEISKVDLLPIGPSQSDLPQDTDYTVAVLGPGTGLGAVGLCKRDGNFVTVVGEASHGGFSPETQEQSELLSVMRDRFERVSIERLLSGPGLENIYWGLARIRGEKIDLLSTADIFQAAIQGNDLLAQHSIDLFYEILGQFAGDLALTLGAKNGIYIAGGIIQRYPHQLSNSQFRRGFESKGRHRALMEQITTQLIMHQQAGLLGVSSYAQMKYSGL
jgi:glucokinase